MTTLAARPTPLPLDPADAATARARLHAARATRAYRIGAVDVILRTNLPRALAAFESHYHWYAQPAPAPGAMELIVRRAWRGLRPRYIISSNGEDRFEVSARDLLPHLEWTLHWQAMPHLRRYYQVHAAVMQRGGGGVLFAADPGNGKSTLAAALLARGWQYLSDEFALIDPDSLNLVPFPKTICIKRTGYALISSLGIPLPRRRAYYRPAKGRLCFLDPHRVRSAPIGSACPVRFVVLAQYVPGTRPSLQPIPRAEAAFDLNRHAFNFHDHGARAIDLLAALVRGAECYRLISGRIHETCDLIESRLR